MAGKEVFTNTSALVIANRFTATPGGGDTMVEFLEIEELEERIAPGGYTGSG
jgi:hypothetical protein